MKIDSLRVTGAACLLAATVATGLAAQATVDGLNDNLSQGLHFYIRGEFKNAIPKFAAALDQLNRTPGFETSASWRVLVSDLALSYVHVGQFDQAKATVDYGLSKDPQYPTFYYDLACLYAKTKDLTRLLAALKQADAFKTHANPGEAIADPSKDEWFKPYWDNATFNRGLSDIRMTGRLHADRLDFTVPAAPWVVTVPAGDFVVRGRDVQPDGHHGRMTFDSAARNTTVTIDIGLADRCADAASCRDLAFNDQLATVDSPQNVKASMLDAIPTFEYYLPASRGQAVRQQHLFAEFVSGGFWAEVHIAKALYVPADRVALEALARSVRMEPKPPRQG